MSINKADLQKAVENIIRQSGKIHQAVIKDEVDWWFNKMGIDASYFNFLQAPSDIAEHIQVSTHTIKLYADPCIVF